MQNRLRGFILLILVATPTVHAQEAIFLIRHAEQMLDVEDPPLTEAGQERAKTWAGIFEKADIKTVYTSKKRRTLQTGEAIAQALNIPLEAIPRQEVTRLVDRIRTQNAGERVLIVTHSRQMPKIYKELGLSAEVSEKVTFSKVEYGNLFIFVPEGEDGGMVIQLRY